MWHVIMNKIIYSLWLCLLLCACAPTAQQVDYSVTYDMSGTKYTQVFMVTTEELLEDLNSNLENYGLELTEMIIGSNRYRGTLKTVETHGRYCLTALKSLR